MTVNRYNFLDIEENYEDAYLERKKDFMSVKDKRKVLSMHLGGIIIECMIKDLIIKNNNFKKIRQNHWYDENTCNIINSIPNANNTIIKDSNIHWNIKNPSHNISDAVSLLNDLQDIIPEDIRAKLKKIEDPLEKGNDDKTISSYIDLRYYSEDAISDTEYSQWLSDFVEVFRWLNNNAEHVKVV